MNTSSLSDQTVHVTTGTGPHQRMLGSITVSRLLGGEETSGQLSLVELVGLPGSGPGSHIDLWRETFYVLEGELTFRHELDGRVEKAVAGPGDSVTIPAGVGHAFSVTSTDAARYLIISTEAGIDQFFAEAGEPIATGEPPTEATPFDRARLRAAFANHHVPSYEFPSE